MCVFACDLFTLVLSLLDVCVLPLVSVEPRLHAEVRLSAPLVQLVPRFVPRQTVGQDTLNRAEGEDFRRATNGQSTQSHKTLELPLNLTSLESSWLWFSSPIWLDMVLRGSVCMLLHHCSLQ